MISNPRHGSPPRLMAHQPTRCSTTQEPQSESIARTPYHRFTNLGIHSPHTESGRIEARTGLRMMPTFPRSPRSFRTAGFPPYGWKAGLSDGAFPDARG